MVEHPSKAAEDYLKTIHSLGGAEHVVTPTAIVERLQVRAPSVTGMLKRLAEAGWITYRSGTGAQLTEEGIAQARRVIRRHRLVELFLTKVLGLDWSEVDAEAEALEHAISPRLEQAIADYLGEPLEDPHGHPIPSQDGEIAVRNLRPLNQLRVSQKAIIREARDDSPERLRQWQSQGLVPGVVVCVLSYEKMDDLFMVQVGEKVFPVSSESMAGLKGEVISD